MYYGGGYYGGGYFGSEDSSVYNSYYYSLSKYHPRFVTDIIEIAEILKAEGFEIGYFKYLINDLFRQMFVETATWGLDLWEKFLGLNNATLTYAERRTMILAKLGGMAITTKALIKSIAESYTGEQVRVIEHPAEYYFEVYFLCTGAPANLDLVQKKIEEIKPAHLGVQYNFMYITWGNLKDKSIDWDTLLDNNTWDDVKTDADYAPEG